jgi:hypothetical protein
MNIAKTKYMSLGIDKNNLELDNGDIITGLPNLGTWDPYLLKTEKTLKKYTVE